MRRDREQAQCGQTQGDGGLPLPRPLPDFVAMTAVIETWEAFPDLNAPIPLTGKTHRRPR